MINPTLNETMEPDTTEIKSDIQAQLNRLSSKWTMSQVQSDLVFFCPEEDSIAIPHYNFKALLHALKALETENPDVMWKMLSRLQA